MDLNKIRAEIQEELRSNPPDAPEDKDLERLLSELAAVSPPDPDVIDLLTADDPPVSLPDGWEQRRAALIERAAATLRPAFVGELLEACRKRSKTTVPEAAEILGAKTNDLENLDDLRDPRFFMRYPPGRVARLAERIGCPRPDFASLARRSLAEEEPLAASIEGKDPAAELAALRRAERRWESKHARDVVALDAWLKEFLTA